MPTPRALLFVLALLSTFGVMAGGPTHPDSGRDQAIRQILSGFWGSARDVHGNAIQPASQEDRLTVPISRAAAYRALEAGNLSGLAEWCGLDWEKHFLGLTKKARRIGMLDKQVAFFSLLHGAGQGASIRSTSGKTCTAEQRARIESLLLESQKEALPSDAMSGWK